MTRLLVIDGYDAGGMKALEAAGATKAGNLYKKMLSGLAPGVQIDVAEISLDKAVGIDIERYAGVCWTGSNLFFSASNTIVQRHIDLCRSLFDAGIPQFGSCWAAQLAAQTAGGTVEQNPKGREFGLARKITLTNSGRTHPMFAGKPIAFDGFTSHADIVTRLPEGATLLAGNSFSPVQALEVRFGKGEFWAVQYHPEYNLSEIACLTHVRQDSLIEQGVFQDEDMVKSYIQDLQTLGQAPSRQDLAWKLGIDSDVMEPDIRTLEVKNWLQHLFGRKVTQTYIEK